MFPDFLPKLTSEITELTSINFAQNIECQLIETPLRSEPIATTYIKQGNTGTPILLLHGFDSSILEFRRLLPLLSQHHQTWAIDLLGLGFTERPQNLNLNPQAILTHLYEAWKTLINEPIILVGVSMGGAVALDFTLAYPQLVKKLILINSAGLKPNPPISKLMFPPLGFLATSFLRNPKVRQKITETAYYDNIWASADALACSNWHLGVPGWDRGLISFTKSGGYGDFSQRLPEIKVETLIVWGENDQILGTDDAHKFHKLIANSQLKWIPKCGHVPHLEWPGITADYILEFCSILNPSLIQP